MDTQQHIPRYLTILVILSGVAFGLFGLADKYFKLLLNPLDLTTYILIFIICISAPIFYLIRMLERVATKVEHLECLSKLAPTETYSDQDTFFIALLAETKKCSSVYTHMLSDFPRVLGQKAVTYFDGVHSLMEKDRSYYRVFRRIASVHSKEKALWVLETIQQLYGVEAFSLAIQYVEDGYPQTSFHVAQGNGVGNIFVWVTMGAGGFGKAFVVRDEAVSTLMAEEHQREFMKSVRLKEGAYIDWANLAHLAQKFELETTPTYKALLEHKNA